MKLTAQLVLTILFVPLFLFSVFSITTKLQLLKPEFWLTSFEKNDIYTNLAMVLKDSAENQVETDGGNKKDIKVLTSLITSENLKITIEKNLTNLLNFANGKTNELVFYIPIQKIPKGLLPKELGQLSEEMTVDTLLQKFNVQGIDKSQIQTFKKVGTSTNYFLIFNISLSLLILVVLIFLVEKGKRFIAPGIAFLFSGIITLLFAGMGYVIRTSVFTDWTKSNEPSQVILATFTPYVLQEILNLWLYIGMGAIMFGVFFLFLKKPQGKSIN